MIFRELIRQWGESGQDLTLVTNSSPNQVDSQSGAGVVSLLPESSNGPLTPIEFLRLAWLSLSAYRVRVRKWVDQLDPSGGGRIVISMSPFPSDVLLAASIARRLRAPCVVYFFHLAPPFWWHPFKRGGLLRTGLFAAAMTFSLALSKVLDFSPALCNLRALNEAGWHFPRVLGVDCFLSTMTEFPAVRWKDRQTDACYVGRIAASKGLIDLVRAWALVTREAPESRLYIAGASHDPRYQEKVRNEIARLELTDNVTLDDFITDTKKGEILQHAKIYVCPSYVEGWSLGVMEAASLGVIPLVYDLPAYDYLGEGAVRVRVGSITELAEKILVLLKRGSDLENRSVATSRLVRGYSPKTIALQQIAAFTDMLEAGTLPPR